MKRWTRLNWLGCGILGALAACSGRVTLGQSPPIREVIEKQGDLVLRLVEDVAQEAADPSALARRVVLLADSAVPSEYWLGIGLGELPEVAKEQLGIESGLVVSDILDDSPAAKAEFKKHDILVKAGDRPLNEPVDLIKVVDASQGKEIAIVVVRGGKDRTITVAPAKRSEETARRETRRTEVLAPKAELTDEIKGLELALQSLKNKAGDGSLGLWFAKPAIVASRVEYKLHTLSKDVKGEFPKDLSVQINKQGGEPTKVHVKQGDKEWNITEDKSGISLRDLPEEIRPHVQQLLEGIPARGNPTATFLRVMPGGKVEGEIKIEPLPPLKAPAAAAPAARAGVPQVAKLHAYRVESGGVEAKLDAILKKLDQLTKEVDELQGRSSSDKK